METMMIQFIWDDPDDDEEDKENKDEEDEDEERREDHLAPPNSTVLCNLLFEAASISLPPEAEVERLLAMPNLPPSPPISLSPPSVRECLLGPRYEAGESFTARPTRGRGVDYGFVSTLDAEERQRGSREVGYGIRDTWVDLAEAVLEIAPMTLREVNTRVTELAELHEHDIQDLYAPLEDTQDRDNTDYGGGDLYFPRGLGSFGTSDTAIAAGYSYSDTTPDIRREIGDMQAELLALREQRRRARQPGPYVRVTDHQDASRGANSHI
ncbi:hypothetical protein Tco_0749045 [Tanacetum coccineum]|uniref:Uncharacterized protein n=1 Tax=Tanacetum coccineum TaxID=301880 RepID=A0ABQ4YXA5_9ASTR